MAAAIKSTYTNQGGLQVVSQSGMFSGNPDGGLILVSGQPGRLNQVVLHNTPGNIWAQSGIPLFFYDGNSVQTSGAPFAASGHKVIGIVNGPVGGSGQIAQTGSLQIQMPFSSGLLVRAASGAPGFSISWTPETVG